MNNEMLLCKVCLALVLPVINDIEQPPKTITNTLM